MAFRGWGCTPTTTVGSANKPKNVKSQYLQGLGALCSRHSPFSLTAGRRPLFLVVPVGQAGSSGNPWGGGLARPTNGRESLCILGNQRRAINFLRGGRCQLQRKQLISVGLWTQRKSRSLRLFWNFVFTFCDNLIIWTRFCIHCLRR